MFKSVSRIFKWVRHLKDKKHRKQSDHRAIHRACLMVYNRNLARPRAIPSVSR